jgi:hypothetical protein
MTALVNSASAGIFAALKDAQLFQKVSIELGALTWPNGADLDPLWVHEEIGKNKTWSPFNLRLIHGNSSWNLHHILKVRIYEQCLHSIPSGVGAGFRGN